MKAKLIEKPTSAKPHFKVTIAVEIPDGPLAESQTRKLCEGVGLLLGKFLSDEEKVELAKKLGIQLSQLKKREPAGRRATA
ncbi:MAG: hypothetical protein IT163_09765 [Bryobacterales bacterium]|nr:hypothetical protein [Bryobacterales bacterium]